MHKILIKFVFLKLNHNFDLNIVKLSDMKTKLEALKVTQLSKEMKISTIGGKMSSGNGRDEKLSSGNARDGRLSSGNGRDDKF